LYRFHGIPFNIILDNDLLFTYSFVKCLKVLSKCLKKLYGPNFVDLIQIYLFIGYSILKEFAQKLCVRSIGSSWNENLFLIRFIIINIKKHGYGSLKNII